MSTTPEKTDDAPKPLLATACTIAGMLTVVAGFILFLAVFDPQAAGAVKFGAFLQLVGSWVGAAILFGIGNLAVTIERIERNTRKPSDSAASPTP